MTTLIYPTNIWFLGAILVSAFGVVASTIVFRRISALHSVRSERRFFIYLFAGVSVLDYIFFVKAVQKSPYFHLGFIWSVAIPTVVFYICLLSLLANLIVVIFDGKARFTIRALVQFIPGLFLIVVMKISYGLAYASPVGAIMAGIDLVFAAVKASGIRRARRMRGRKVD
jgi:hypothetical protein